MAPDIRWRCHVDLSFSSDLNTGLSCVAFEVLVVQAPQERQGPPFSATVALRNAMAHNIIFLRIQETAATES
eukprot:9492106-Pyramimonas_sp.AAC.1